MIRSIKRKILISYIFSSTLISIKKKASTFQMAILLLFNEKTEYLVKDIVELTQIKMDTLVQVLGVLFKSKLLVSDEEEIEEAEIQSNTPVRLFLNYKK
jgi:cullin 1